MVAKSTEAARRWEPKSEIDYSTYFVTAWITFNAWYGKRYSGTKTERRKLEKIKSKSSDLFHKSINDLLEGSGQEATEFRNHLGSLYKALEDARIKCDDGSSVLFDKVLSMKNSIDTINQTFNGITYLLNRKSIVLANGKRSFEIETQIINKSSIILFRDRISAFSENIFFSNVDNSSLSQTQKSQVKPMFRELKPFVIVKVTEDKNRLPRSDYYMLGGRKFIRDKNAINDEGRFVTGALIEILYKLRNVLFHGDLQPNGKTQLVYKNAYLIMRMLITKLT